LVIAAFLWFMIKPLFDLSPGSGKITLAHRIARLFRNGLAGFMRTLKDFFASLGKRGSSVRINISKGDVQNMSEDLLAAWSRARKRELRRSLDLFARLILWGGQKYQAIWKPSMGPGEYCGILAAAVREAARAGGNGGAPAIPVEQMPEQIPGQGAVEQIPGQGADSGDENNTATAILRCGEIFEEALYGPRSTDKKTQREFRDLVEGITA
jgi:hypothetical protein